MPARNTRRKPIVLAYRLREFPLIHLLQRLQPLPPARLELACFIHPIVPELAEVPFSRLRERKQLPPRATGEIYAVCSVVYGLIVEHLTVVASGRSAVEWWREGALMTMGFHVTAAFDDVVREFRRVAEVRTMTELLADAMQLRDLDDDLGDRPIARGSQVARAIAGATRGAAPRAMSEATVRQLAGLLPMWATSTWTAQQEAAARALITAGQLPVIVKRFLRNDEYLFDVGSLLRTTLARLGVPDEDVSRELVSAVDVRLDSLAVYLAAQPITSLRRHLARGRGEPASDTEKATLAALFRITLEAFPRLAKALPASW